MDGTWWISSPIISLTSYTSQPVPVWALPEVVWNLFVGLCIVSFDYILLENVLRPRRTFFRCETLSSSVFSRDNDDVNVLVVAVLKLAHYF